MAKPYPQRKPQKIEEQPVYLKHSRHALAMPGTAPIVIPLGDSAQTDGLGALPEPALATEEDIEIQVELLRQSGASDEEIAQLHRELAAELFFRRLDQAEGLEGAPPVYHPTRSVALDSYLEQMQQAGASEEEIRLEEDEWLGDEATRIAWEDEQYDLQMLRREQQYLAQLQHSIEAEKQGLSEEMLSADQVLSYYLDYRRHHGASEEAIEDLRQAGLEQIAGLRAASPQDIPTRLPSVHGEALTAQDEHDYAEFQRLKRPASPLPAPPAPDQAGYTVINRTVLRGKQFDWAEKLEELGYEYQLIRYPPPEYYTMPDLATGKPAHYAIEPRKAHPQYTFGMDQPTFAWTQANGSRSELYVDGLSQQEFYALTGIQPEDSKPGKCAKRTNRYMREYYLRGRFNSDNLDIDFVSVPDIKRVDAGGVIRRSVLRKMTLAEDLPEEKRAKLLHEIEHSYRIEYTLNDADGQHKGHAIVLDDDEAPAGFPDFRLPRDCKPELKTINGQTMLGINFVHGKDHINIDEQSLMNLMPFLEPSHYQVYLEEHLRDFIEAADAIDNHSMAQTLRRTQGKDITPEDMLRNPTFAYAMAGGQVNWSATMTKAFYSQAESKVIRPDGKTQIPMTGLKLYLMSDAVAEMGGLPVKVQRGEFRADIKRDTVWINSDDWCRLDDSPPDKNYGMADVAGGGDFDDGAIILPFLDQFTGREAALVFRQPNGLGEVMLLRPAQDSDRPPNLDKLPHCDSRQLPERVDQNTALHFLGLLDPSTALSTEGLSHDEVQEKIAERARASSGIMPQEILGVSHRRATNYAILDEEGIPVRAVATEDLVDNSQKLMGDSSPVEAFTQQAALERQASAEPEPAFVARRNTYQQPWYDTHDIARLQPTTDHFLDDHLRNINYFTDTVAERSTQGFQAAMPPRCVIDQAMADEGLLKQARKYNENYHNVLATEKEARFKAARRQADLLVRPQIKQIHTQLNSYHREQLQHIQALEAEEQTTDSAQHFEQLRQKLRQAIDDKKRNLVKKVKKNVLRGCIKEAAKEAHQAAAIAALEFLDNQTDYDAGDVLIAAWASPYLDRMAKGEETKGDGAAWISGPRDEQGNLTRGPGHILTAAMIEKGWLGNGPSSVTNNPNDPLYSRPQRVYIADVWWNEVNRHRVENNLQPYTTTRGLDRDEVDAAKTRLKDKGWTGFNNLQLTVRVEKDTKGNPRPMVYTPEGQRFGHLVDCQAQDGANFTIQHTLLEERNGNLNAIGEWQGYTQPSPAPSISFPAPSTQCGGWSRTGAGTALGDGMQKAISDKAVKAIVELAHDRPSFAHTILERKGAYDSRSPEPGIPIGLTRDGELGGQPLRPETQQTILTAHNAGCSFLVGTTDSDQPFIEYLDRIGASYTPYHHGNDYYEPLHTRPAKGGYSQRGRGTPQGDGKDSAMRKLASRAIVELSDDKPCSPHTTLETLGAYRDNPQAQTTVMLARSDELAGARLLDETKQTILQAHQAGCTFVVGDTPRVDRPFIAYLEHIGAQYEIHYAGDKCRIPLTYTTRTSQPPPKRIIKKESRRRAKSAGKEDAHEQAGQVKKKKNS